MGASAASWGRSAVFVNAQRWLIEAINPPTLVSRRTVPRATAGITKRVPRIPNIRAPTASVREPPRVMAMRRPREKKASGAPGEELKSIKDLHELLRESWSTGIRPAEAKTLQKWFADSKRSEPLVRELLRMLQETEGMRFSAQTAILTLGRSVPEKPNAMTVERFETLVQAALLSENSITKRSAAFLSEIWQSDWFTKGLVSRKAQESVEKMLVLALEYASLPVEVDQKVFEALWKFHSQESIVTFLLGDELRFLYENTKRTSDPPKKTVVRSSPRRKTSDPLGARYSHEDFRQIAYEFMRIGSGNIDVAEKKTEFIVTDNASKIGAFVFSIGQGESCQGMAWDMIRWAWCAQNVTSYRWSVIRTVYEYVLCPISTDKSSSEAEIAQALATPTRWHDSGEKRQSLPSLLGIAGHSADAQYFLGQHSKTKKIVCIQVLNEGAAIIGDLFFKRVQICIPQENQFTVVSEFNLRYRHFGAQQALKKALRQRGYRLLPERLMETFRGRPSDLTAEVVFKTLGFKKLPPDSITITRDNQSYVIPFMFLGRGSGVGSPWAVHYDRSTPSIAVAFDQHGSLTVWDIRKESYASFAGRMFSRVGADNLFSTALQLAEKTHPIHRLMNPRQLLEEVSKSIEVGTLVKGFDSYFDEKNVLAGLDTELRYAGFVRVTEDCHLKLYPEAVFPVSFLPSMPLGDTHWSIVEQLGFSRELLKRCLEESKETKNSLFESARRGHEFKGPKLYRDLTETARFVLISWEAFNAQLKLHKTYFGDYFYEGHAITSDGHEFPIRLYLKTPILLTPEEFKIRLAAIGLEEVQSHELEVQGQNVKSTLNGLAVGDLVQLKYQQKNPERRRLEPLIPQLIRSGFTRVAFDPNSMNTWHYIKMPPVPAASLSPLDRERFLSARELVLRRAKEESHNGRGIFPAGFDFSVIKLIETMFSNPKAIHELYGPYAVAVDPCMIPKSAVHSVVMLLNALGELPEISEEMAKRCSSLLLNATGVIYEELCSESVEEHLSLAEVLVGTNVAQKRPILRVIAGPLCQWVEIVCIAARMLGDDAQKSRVDKLLSRIPKPSTHMEVKAQENDMDSKKFAQVEAFIKDFWPSAQNEAFVSFYLCRFLFKEAGLPLRFISLTEFKEIATAVLTDYARDANRSKSSLHAIEMSYRFRFINKVSEHVLDRMTIAVPPSKQLLWGAVRILHLCLQTAKSEFGPESLGERWKHYPVAKEFLVYASQLIKATGELRRLSGRLPPVEQKVVNAKWPEDHFRSHQEVAASLGVSLGTIVFILKHALQRVIPNTLEGPHASEDVEHTTVPSKKEVAQGNARELEDGLLKFVDDRPLPKTQKQLLPFLLRGLDDEAVAKQVGLSIDVVTVRLQRLRQEVRYWFVLGMLDEYGPIENVKKMLIQLLSESPLERFMRRIGHDNVLEATSADPAFIQELLARFGVQFSEEELERLLQSKPYQQIVDQIQRSPGERNKEAVKRTIQFLLGDKKKAETVPGEIWVFLRDFRDFYFPHMDRDYKAKSRDTLDFLKQQINQHPEGSLQRYLYEQTYTYYDSSLAFEPRGFNVYQGEEMTLAQRCTIWQSLQTLQDPRERCAINTSESRSRKTASTILTAFNIRDETGEYAVKRLLYTTKRTALAEVADEIRKRTNGDLSLKVIVLDGTKAQQEEALKQAATMEGNVVLLANYHAVKKWSGKIGQQFTPDCHAIDEAQAVKSGDAIDLAPPILNIRAKYRMAISANPAPTRKQDIAAILSWARHQKYPNPAELRRKGHLELFSILAPVTVHWRRLVIHPELGEPKLVTREVPYSAEEAFHAFTMRRDVLNWRQKHAEEKYKKSPRDHQFSRFALESVIGLNLGLLLEGRKIEESLNHSSKIQILDEIIRKRVRANDKVIVVAPRLEVIKPLVARYNKLFGEASFAVAALESADLHSVVQQFRANRHPWVVFTTEYRAGTSLNWCREKNSPFDTATVVRLAYDNRGASDVGDRLIAPTQIKTPQVITLVNTFPEEPTEDALTALFYLDRFAKSGIADKNSHELFVRQALRRANLDEQTIENILARFASGESMNSVQELSEAFQPDIVEGILKAFRPKTFDQMRHENVEVKKKMKSGILRGKVAELEEQAELGVSVLRGDLRFALPVGRTHPHWDLKKIESVQTDLLSPSEAEQEEAEEAPIDLISVPEEEVKEQTFATITLASSLKKQPTPMDEKSAQTRPATLRAEAPPRREKALVASASSAKGHPHAQPVEIDGELKRFATASELQELRKKNSKNSESLIEAINARQKAWYASANDVTSLPWEARIAVFVLSRNPSRALQSSSDEMTTEPIWNNFVDNAIDRSSSQITEEAKTHLRQMLLLGWSALDKDERAQNLEEFLATAIVDSERFYALRPLAPRAMAILPHEAKPIQSPNGRFPLPSNENKSDQLEAVLELLNSATDNALNAAGLGKTVVSKILGYLASGETFYSFMDLKKIGISTDPHFIERLVNSLLAWEASAPQKKLALSA